MDHERWLAPLTGAIAMGTALGIVAVYVYGRELPVEHVATVSTRVPVAPARAWELLSDPGRRPDWTPHVARIGRVEDVAGRPTWRELDASQDRFDFTVVSDTFPTFEVAAAHPEDIGMIATWRWTLAADGDGTRVTLTERGSIDNLLFRGVWALRTGPWEGVEEDLSAFGRALGGDGVLQRVEGTRSASP